MSKDIYPILKPLLINQLESETAKNISIATLGGLEGHQSATRVFRERFIPAEELVTDDRLECDISGIPVDNILGLGAGWSKNAESLLGIQSVVNLGHAEIGTVTRFPQPGNPRPRMWRVKSPFYPYEEVTANRMGFPSEGMEVVYDRLLYYQQIFTQNGIHFPVGVSLGKNNTDSKQDIPYAHLQLAGKFSPLAAWLTINASCPNIRDPKALEDMKLLRNTVEAVIEGMNKGVQRPLFIKISPDIHPGHLDRIIETVYDYDLAGLIAVNTTVNPGIKDQYGMGIEHGGLAGGDPVYRDTATSMIGYIYRATRGEIQIIGVGGIYDLHSAYEKIAAGALPLQIVSGLSNRGPGVANRIMYELLQIMERDGIDQVGELRGSAYPSI